MPPEIGIRIHSGSRGDHRNHHRAATGPLRIALVGDFRGRGSGGATTSTQQPDPGGRLGLARIDVDNFDRVLSRLAPRLRLAAGDAEDTAIDLSFACLDDFHPDGLFRRLEVARALEAARRQLLEGLAAQGGAEESDAGTLDRILGRRAGGEPPGAELPGRVDRVLRPFLRGIVAPYVVAGPSPRE
jgi:type VI secretion system ImpB/VipA family protein